MKSATPGVAALIVSRSLERALPRNGPLQLCMMVLVGLFFSFVVLALARVWVAQTLVDKNDCDPLNQTVRLRDETRRRQAIIKGKKAMRQQAYTQHAIDGRWCT